jgi:hypothetical protein
MTRVPAALVVPACLILPRPRFTRRLEQARSWPPLVVALVVGVGVYVLATGRLFDPQRHIAHMHALLFDRNRLSRAATYFSPSPVFASAEARQ